MTRRSISLFSLASAVLIALVASMARADDYLPLFNDAFKSQPTVYKKQQQLVQPEDWYDAFTFDTEQTKYHGYSEFVDKNTAHELNLIGSGQGGKGFRFGAYTGDPKTYRRPTIRMKSTQTYKNGVYVFTINKAPVACSLWASIFTQSPKTDSVWRSEIDIFEYANGYTRPNAIVIHTAGNCDATDMLRNSLTQGDKLMNTCTKRLGVSGRRGCGIYLSQDQSSPAVPKNMNRQKTVIVTERSESAINAWFWTYDDAPEAMKSVTQIDKLDTKSLGKPILSLPAWKACTTDPALDSDHYIIMMLDFCGGLPDFYWNKDGCNARAESCPQYHNTLAAGKEMESNGGGYFEFDNFVFFGDGLSGDPETEKSHAHQVQMQHAGAQTALHISAGGNNNDDEDDKEADDRELSFKAQVHGKHGAHDSHKKDQHVHKEDHHGGDHHHHHGGKHRRRSVLSHMKRGRGNAHLDHSTRSPHDTLMGLFDHDYPHA